MVTHIIHKILKERSKMQEEIELFVEAYQEKMEALKSKVTYTEAKEKAFAYALSVVPELKPHWEAFQERRYMRGPIQPEHKIGHTLITRAGAVIRANKYSEETFRPSEETRSAEKPDETPKIAPLYEKWVTKNDFIPDDMVLSRFSPHVTHFAFTSSRTRLTSKGWEFKKVEHGWLVVKRPDDERTRKIDELTIVVENALRELKDLQNGHRP